MNVTTKTKGEREKENIEMSKKDAKIKRPMKIYSQNSSA